MPIIQKGKNLSAPGYIQKRQERNKELRTKFKRVKRITGDEQDFKEQIEVYVNGKKVNLSEASLYMIDMMIKQQ